MKGMTAKGLSLSILLLCQFSVAFGFTSGDLTYSVSGVGATVTGLSDPSYSGDIVIPKTVVYEGVTLLVLAVKESAFSGSNLTGVTIPSTVMDVGDKAFYNCKNLKTVTIEDGEDEMAIGYSYVDIGGDFSTSFKDCPVETLYLGRNLSYDCIWTPSLSPFRDNTALTTVTIGEQVTSIGISLFYGCTGVKDVVSLNPEPPTCEDAYAFYGVATSACVLTVPLDSKKLYRTAYGWKDFPNIVEEPVDGNMVMEDVVIDLDGMKANTEDITPNVSFKIDYSMVNTSRTLSYAGPLRFGLSNKEGFIREWITDPIAIPTLNPNVGRSTYGQTCLITIEIEDGDRIRLYYQDAEAGSWKLIKGITTTNAWEIVFGDDDGASMDPIDGNTVEDAMKLYGYGLKCGNDDIVPDEEFYIRFMVLNTSSINHAGKYRFGLCNELGFIKEWISPFFDTDLVEEDGVAQHTSFSTSLWCLVNKIEDGDRIRFYYKDEKSDIWKLLTPYSDGVVWEIVLGDETGITGATMEDGATETGRYTLDGKKTDTPQKGVNIVRYSDGTVRKALVK